MPRSWIAACICCLRVSAAAFAIRCGSPVAMMFRQAMPAARDTGLALNVPGWGILLARSLTGSSVCWITFSSSSLPATHPPGIAPMSILAMVDMSGSTPMVSCQPPGAQRNPLTTSSMMNTVPYLVHSSRAARAYSAEVGTEPMCAPAPSMMSAATSLLDRAFSRAGTSFVGRVITLSWTPGARPAEGISNGGSIPAKSASAHP